MMVVTIVVRRNSGVNSAAKLGRFERARLLLLLPHRRLRQERPDEDQRDGRDDARNERVAPRLMATPDERQRLGVGDDQVVHAGDHQAADRAERLRVADHAFAHLRVGKQLRQPRHRGHELHADADERAAAPEQQPFDGRRVAGRQRREGVEQDAPDEHAPAAEAGRSDSRRAGRRCRPPPPACTASSRPTR